jgi:FkbM family methyltransferase
MTMMMRELTFGAIRTVTSRLPPVRGVGRVYHALANLLPEAQDRALTDVDVLGFRMRLDRDDYVDRHLLLAPHLYDRWELGEIRRHVGPGDIVLDIGAHIGVYTMVLAKQVGPTGRVVAVEANPPTFRRLKDHLLVNGMSNVTALSCGVSDAEGPMTLWLNSRNNLSGHNFVRRDGDEWAGPEVPCRTLYQIVLECGLERIDFAKFDIENMEYRVLARYLADAPRRLLPKLLLTEYKPEEIRYDGGNLHALLTAHGYVQCGVNRVNRLYERST